MEYNLFLDDVRGIPAAGGSYDEKTDSRLWVLARNSEQAVEIVRDLGAPVFMSLDHDLGGDDNALVFLKFLARYYDFVPEYVIHSANPVGAENIRSFMESWKRSLE